MMFTNFANELGHHIAGWTPALNLLGIDADPRAEPKLDCKEDDLLKFSGAAAESQLRFHDVGCEVRILSSISDISGLW